MRLMKKIDVGIEEAILLFIIITALFDWLEYFPADFDFIRKVISWTALGYLIYRISPTKLLFGYTKKDADALIIIGGFLFLMKTFVGFVHSAVAELKITITGTLFSVKQSFLADNGIGASRIITNGVPDSINLSALPAQIPVGDLSSQTGLPIMQMLLDNLDAIRNIVVLHLTNAQGEALLVGGAKAGSFITGFYQIILDNALALEMYSFIGGMLLFAIISILLIRVPAKKESVYGALHEQKKPKTIKQHIYRFIFNYVVLSAFFIIFFNLVFEWLAIAIDAPLIIFGIFFYLLFWVKHAKHFHSSTFIYKLGNMGEGFYEKFSLLFRSKKTILLALTGLLVLHALTELGNFVIPYIFGFHDALYFEQLGLGHTSLLPMLLLDAAQANIVLVSIAYIANTIALILLICIPALLWYDIYAHKKFTLPHWLSAAFFSSLIIFIMNPVFTIGRIAGKHLIGVDIMTQQLPRPETLLFLIIVSAVVSVFAYVVSDRFRLRELAYGATVAFFIYYITLFFIDFSAYYAELIPTLIMLGEYLLVIQFFIFFTITIAFYVCGGLYFVYLTFLLLFAKN